MRRLFLLLLLCGMTLPALARDAAHPRIGLVLSGGGARGAAHVGVLKVLEELRIPISVIAGTSMGALVGGVYASGVSPEEMERRLTTADWDFLFVDEPPREDWPIRRKDQGMRPTWDFSLGVDDKGLQLPKGALAGQKVELFFADLVKGADGVRNFDDLPIPFRAVATDLENGGMRVFDSGPLPEVMRASMSVPGLFSPVEIEDHLYVDGGLVRNLPVDVARKMGVDLVIAVNLGSGYLPRDQLGSVVGVLGQMIAILTEQNVQRSLKELHKGKDILIVPDLGDITSSDFNRAADAIKTGEDAARAATAQLKRLSLSPEAYAAWRASRPALATDAVATIAVVEVRGLKQVNPEVFAPLIAHQEGRPLDRPRLEKDIQDLYGFGDYQSINYHIEQRDGKDVLVVAAAEKSIGPGYLTFGLNFSSDFKGDNLLGIRATYRRTWLNSLGAEWLATAQIGNVLDLYTELYQPLRVDRAWFVAPYAGIGRAPLNVFRDGNRIARYDLTRAAAGIDLGATLGTDAELRVGVSGGYASLKLDTGDPSLPQDQENESGLRAAFRYDTLDSAFVPRKGNRLTLDLFSPQPALGAANSYNRLEGNWVGAWSLGNHTLVGRARLGGALGGDLPYYDEFAMGGLFDLPGYATGELRAGQIAYGGLAYFHRLTTLKPPLGRGVYAGFSLEGADLQDSFLGLTPSGTRFGSSVFLGADTWLGPAYFGLGVNGDGDAAAYLQLGKP
jgi:NTE family protein